MLEPSFTYKVYPASNPPSALITLTLSTACGMVYVCNRDIDGRPTLHDDREFTTIDFETGVRVFSLKPYFDEGEFHDNIRGLKTKMSMGKDEYDRKVFNNLWGTFCFGPNNSLFLGAYRGDIRFKSDSE